VIETRETDEDTTRRRRQCLKCKERFTTYEKSDNFNLRVIKKDGNRELFDKEKIRRGVLKACEKRPISIEAIDAFVNDIERTLRSRYPKEVKSTLIGDLVVNRLKKLDSVAYIRFASVYREFADLTDLQNEIKRLMGDKRHNKNSGYQRQRKKTVKNKGLRGL